jgi:two-component system, chemotaxis family, sensor histidine kinase and response regulator PixL
MSSPEDGVAQPQALVVDDDTGIRTLVEAILSRSGFAVAAAVDGDDAIKKLESGMAVDLILLDLMMPRVDGYGVVAWINAHRPELASRVVVMTAFSRSAIDRLGFACPILAKPFDLQELVTVARERGTRPVERAAQRLPSASSIR